MAEVTIDVDEDRDAPFTLSDDTYFSVENVIPGITESYTFSGAIDGNYFLGKVGDGELWLSGLNSYNGGTRLKEGTLGLDHPGALGIYVNDNDPTSFAGTLQIIGNGTTLATKSNHLELSNLILIGDTISNTGSVTVDIRNEGIFEISGVTNKYDKIGGAISVLVGQEKIGETVTAALNFTQGGNLVLSGNSAEFGGGVGADVLMTGQYVFLDFSELSSTTFLSNTAENDGGAIFLSSETGASLIMGGNTAFYDNKAQDGSGGAIYLYSPGDKSSATLGQNVLFENNSAGLYGGAIYAASNFTVRGNTLFHENSASLNGGAIYMNGFGTANKLTLDAADGAIVFSGNTVGISNPRNNSVYLSQNTELALTGNDNIYFDDPISTGAQGGNSLTKTGNGFVQFVGDSVLNPNDKSNGEVTISGGEFRVVTGASFTTGGSDDKRFNVTGGTLAGGGTITSQNGFYISGTISPDDLRYETPDFDPATNGFGPTKTPTGGAVGTLTLIGNTTFDGATLAVDIASANSHDKIAVTGLVGISGSNTLDLNLDSWMIGTIDLITSTDAMTNTGTFTVTHNLGSVYDDAHYGKTVAVSEQKLQLTLAIANQALTWTGASNGLWDVMTSQNWTNVDATTKLFADGDSVTFADLTDGSPHSVNVAPAQVAIGGMTVTGTQDWTFSGGGISGTGGLTMNGTGTVTLTNQNTYGGTTTINSGTVRIGNGGATGSISSAAAIGTDGRLEFYSNDNTTLEIANAVSGTGEIAFLGTGNPNESSYKYTGNSTGFTGNVRVKSGARFILENDDNLSTNAISVENGGQVYLASNRIYANSLNIVGNGWNETGGTYGALRMGEDADLTGNLTLTGNARIGVLNGAATISGIIADGDNGYTLEKTGSGKLILTGINTHVGATTIAAGSLALSGNGSIAASSGVSLANGTSFDISGVTDSASIQSLSGTGSVALGGKILVVGNGGANSTFSGTISGTGGVTKTGSGNLTLANSSSFGNLDIAGGALIVANGKTITLSDEAKIAGILSVSVGTTALAAKKITFDASGSGIVNLSTYSGADSWVIATASDVNGITGSYHATVGENPFPGTNYLDKYSDASIWRSDDGRELLAKQDLLWNATANNSAHGVFNVAGVYSLTVGLASNTDTAAWYSETGYSWDGNSLIKRGGGTLILGAANTYTGKTTVEAGILRIDHAGALTLSDVVLGAATLESTGATTIKSLTSDGGIIDSTGVLTVTGDLSLAGTRLEFAAGTDQIVVEGNVSFGSSKNTINLAAFVEGDDIELIVSNGMTGSADDYFNAVTIAGNAITGRRSADLRIENDIIYLNAAVANNLDLQWTDGDNGVWTSTGTWNIVGETGTDTFAQRDSVVFNAGGTTKNIVVDGDTIVSGMKVDGGSYTFSGDTITGEANAKGDSATKTGKLEIASGASATFRNAISFAEGIDNAGSLVFDPETVLHLDSAIGGAGSVAQTGGELVLRGVNTSTGTFTQSGGTLGLESDWYGDFIQTDGLLKTDDGRQLRENAVFGGVVDPTGTLYVSKNMELDGATLTFAPTVDKIDVGGAVTFGTQINTVDLSNFVTGTDIVLIASTDMTGNAGDYFGAVTLMGGELGANQSAILRIDGDRLLLTAKLGTSNSLVWIAGDDGAWTTTGDWKIAGTDPPQTGTFNQGDFVTFDDSGTNKNVNVTGSVTVSGMRVEGGRYTFSGSTITGITSTSGDLVTPTGKLEISGTGTSATFSNTISFAGGIDVGSGSELFLAQTSALVLDKTVSGNGNVTKTGSGLLTISGTNSNSGVFTQQNGTVDLRTNWAGNYVQTSGTLESASGARITGNATFADTVDPDGVLNIGGNLTVNGATLKIDTTTNDFLKVTGTASLVGVSIDLARFANGEYTILDSNGLDWDSITTTLRGSSLNARQGVSYRNENDSLVLAMTVENTTLTWKGGNGSWLGSNWNGSPDEEFIDGDTVTFGSGSGTVALDGETVMPANMTVQSGADYLFKNGTIEATGAILVEKGGRMGLDVSNTKLVGESVTFLGDLYLSGTPTAAPGETETVSNVITATGGDIDQSRFETLFNSSTALESRTAVFGTSGQAESMSLEFTTLTVEQFTSKNHLSGNMTNMAELFDEAVRGNQGMHGFFYGEGAFETEASLERFLFGSLGAELAANAQTMALWNPWKLVYDRMYEVNEHYSREWSGQCCTRRSTRQLWAAGYYRGEDVDSDGNANGYDGSRGGLIVGVDTKLNSWALAGLVFGYGSPQIKNGIGKVEADDYTFALYSKIRVVGDLHANAFLGYGHQEYKYRRHSVGPGKTGYDGDSMYASVEFFRPARLLNGIVLFPLFAVDFQKAWIDGFTESTSDVSQISVAKNDIGQTVLRFGLNSKYATGEGFNLRTRLQYGVQVGGNTQGRALTSLVVNPGESRMLTGVNLGRNTFNVGIGGDYRIGMNRRTRIFADYDFDLGEKATAHTGQVGFVTNW